VGLTAGESRSLCSNLLLLEQDVIRDDRTLTALGRWLTRFTPIVARLEPFVEGDAPPTTLLLDLTGCERLFGGIVSLANQVRQSLHDLQLDARIAIAPTPGAAWAVALVTQDRSIRLIRETSLRKVVQTLPVQTLRLDTQTVADLLHLGIKHVGDVLALPREQLPARFGPLLLKRIDQLLGTRPEPLNGLIYQPPVTAGMEFEYAIEALEEVGLIFERLLDLVLTDLISRGRGVRTLRLVFKPDTGWGRAIFTRTIDLNRPHRHRPTLVNLIHFQLEHVDLEHGFTRFQLDVPKHEPIADQQIDLFDQQAIESATEFDRLLQRLQGKIGRDSVIQPQLIESYLPERAWSLATDSTSSLSRSPGTETVPLVLPQRPLTLFPSPEEIRVVSEPSDDRTGSPRQFTWRGQVHQLAFSVGPERIAGEWWRGHKRTRDYYDVEDTLGRRFWVFRVLHVQDETIVARWFIHGRFD
jgi:protein ImuB